MHIRPQTTQPNPCFLNNSAFWVVLFCSKVVQCLFDWFLIKRTVSETDWLDCWLTCIQNDTFLECQKCVKTLGVIIDDLLSYVDNINAISGSCCFMFHNKWKISPFLKNYSDPNPGLSHFTSTATPSPANLHLSSPQVHLKCCCLTPEMLTLYLCSGLFPGMC